MLLDPLGPGGDRRVRLTADAVLLFDGVFLLRPELIDRWELRVLVSTDMERTVERAARRDGAASRRRWRERYLPAQELYLAAVRPGSRAHFVVHNDDPGRPVLVQP